MMRSMTETGEPKKVAYGDVDVWDYHLKDEASVAICANQRSFMHYLCSRGTLKMVLEEANPTQGTAGVTLVGPKCDDGYRMTLYYKLYASQVHDEFPFGLAADEQRILVGVAREALSRSGKVNAFGLFAHCLRLPRVL